MIPDEKDVFAGYAGSASCKDCHGEAYDLWKTSNHAMAERQPVAVLIGNEGGGISAAEITACDTMLRIPQNRSVESLNSGIAAAVILYEAAQRREQA